MLVVYGTGDGRAATVANHVVDGLASRAGWPPGVQGVLVVSVLPHSGHCVRSPSVGWTAVFQASDPTGALNPHCLQLVRPGWTVS